MIFKEIKELKSDLKLQQIENGRKQDQIIDLRHENKNLQWQIDELKNEKKHLEDQLEQALKDYDKLLNKIGKKDKKND